jgi:hypothetical protein
MIPDNVYRGLLVICDHCIHNADEYAYFRWPNSYHKARRAGDKTAILDHARASLRRLTEGGYVKLNTVYELYELTPAGRAALDERLEEIRNAFGSVRGQMLVPDVSAKAEKC